MEVGEKRLWLEKWQREERLWYMEGVVLSSLGQRQYCGYCISFAVLKQTE